MIQNHAELTGTEYSHIIRINKRTQQIKIMLEIFQQNRLIGHPAFSKADTKPCRDDKNKKIA
jgi:hypothetical protein